MTAATTTTQLRRVRYVCTQCGEVPARRVRQINWYDGPGWAHEAMTPSGLHAVTRHTEQCEPTRLVYPDSVCVCGHRGEDHRDSCGAWKAECFECRCEGFRHPQERARG